jgi:hypothetical protein
MNIRYDLHLELHYFGCSFGSEANNASATSLASRFIDASIDLDQKAS